MLWFFRVIPLGKKTERYGAHYEQYSDDDLFATSSEKLCCFLNLDLFDFSEKAKLKYLGIKLIQH